MREVTAKSIKLNRDLEKMLAEALERDLLVRIGWGRNGDEKPKNGEIGVITHLPKKSRVSVSYTHLTLPTIYSV